MTETRSLFPLLDTSDVSYDKLVELERRLIAATTAGKVSWERQGDEYSWSSPKGVVDVTTDGVSIYDDRGNRIRRFRYETNTLYVTARDEFAAMVTDTIDRIMADLDALAGAE